MHSSIASRLAAGLDCIAFSRFVRAGAEALAAFGALALPSACVVCGRWDTSLCMGCSRSFRSATARPFRAEEAAEALPDVEVPPGRSRVPTGERGAWDRVGGDMYGPLPVVAAGRYGREVSAVMLAYKNHGHVDLTGPVAAALGAALHEALSGGALNDRPGRPILLVPVPTRTAARRRRGYDPLMMLLSQLARTGRLPAGAALAPWLRPVPLVVRLAASQRGGRVPRGGHLLLEVLASGVTGGQKGSNRRRRRSNVVNSMVLPGSRHGQVEGRHCLIIDDVLTTGATIGEAHRALVDAGAQVLGAVVVAATRSPAGDRASGCPSGAGRLQEAGRRHEGPADVAELSERQGMNNGRV